MTLVHFVWILPDAALVGLAQLRAEGAHDRTRDVVLAVRRLNLILAGVVDCAVLASNAGFVRVWVGADLFSGAPLNALFAANAVLIWLVVISGIFGSRLKVGIVSVVNGLLHIVLASIWGRYIGAYGVCIATLVSGAVTALPVGLRLLQVNTGVTASTLWAQLYWP
jgi:hypothetical protein